MAGRILILVLLAAVVLGGCDVARYTGYLLTPTSKKEVEAEFDGLPGHSVAIVIFADQGVLYEYPHVQGRLSALIANELRENVTEKKALSKTKKVTVIAPARVLKYQHENVNWDEMPRTKLGQVFGADYVLYVSLVGYTMREPGSLNLYRGMVTAEGSLYETTAKSRQEARVWHANDLRIVFPEKGAGRLADDRRIIRKETDSRFADLLAKKFYDYEVPLEE